MIKTAIFILLIVDYTCIGTSDLPANNDFVATEEWQEVGPDQSVPSGLHIQFNFTSGKKLAKLITDTTSDDNKHQDVIVYPTPSTDDLDSEWYDPLLTNQRIYDPHVYQKNFSTLEELKEDLESLKLNYPKSTQHVAALVDEFVESWENKIYTLKVLEHMLHNFDDALIFTNMGGTSKVIIPGLNSTSLELKKLTMSVIGAAAQSNPVVQLDFLDQKILQRLITLLSHDCDFGLQISSLYAISNTIRGFPYGQKEFIEIGGLDTILSVFVRNHDWTNRLHIKILSLIRNLLEEKKYAIGPKAKLLQEINIEKHLAAGNWCPQIPLALHYAFHRDHGDISQFWRCDYEILEPLIQVMKYLAPLCKSDFLDHEKTLSELSTFLKEQYDLNECDFDIWDDVVELLKEIMQKDEL